MDSFIKIALQAGRVFRPGDEGVRRRRKKETKGVEGAKEACESATNALIDLKWAVEAALEKEKAEG